LEIDSTIVAGIMTSVATLIAAFITFASVKKANSNLEESVRYSIFNKNYTVLVRKTDNKTMVVKDGFSWVAVFFHVFWLFYSRLWEVIFTVLLISGGLFLHFYIVDNVGNTDFLSYFEKAARYVVVYSPFILGMFGNRLLMRKYTHSFCLLDNRNYRVVDSVVATTKTNAILKFMEKSNG
jgi:hypothetical protein